MAGFPDGLGPSPTIFSKSAKTGPLQIKTGSQTPHEIQDIYTKALAEAPNGSKSDASTSSQPSTIQLKQIRDSTPALPDIVKKTVEIDDTPRKRRQDFRVVLQALKDEEERKAYYMKFFS